MRRRLILRSLFALVLAAPLARAADGVSTADARAVRSVIEAQLAAFAADDAARAFALAAPAIRAQFGNAENFLAMVQQSYPVVYRPAAVRFLEPQHYEGDVLQRVQMSDREGRNWVAVYRVQRQADRRWRIAGCQVVQSEGFTT